MQRNNRNRTSRNRNNRTTRTRSNNSINEISLLNGSNNELGSLNGSNNEISLLNESININNNNRSRRNRRNSRNNIGSLNGSNNEISLLNESINGSNNVVTIDNLFYAIENNNEEFALELIKSGKINLASVNSNGDTALIVACYKKMENVSLELIKTGYSMPSAINSKVNTALILACGNKMEKVALELIKTGESNPGVISSKGNTALILACRNKMENVALELIKTGESNPNVVDSFGNAALIYACLNNMEKVALEIIKTGDSNYEHIDKRGKKAIDYIIKNNLTSVIKFIKENKEILGHLITFDIKDKQCYDPLEATEVDIKQFISSDRDNLVLVFFDKDLNKNQCVGINYSLLFGANKVNYDDYGIYECKEARELRNGGTRETNIIRYIKYFNIKSLCGFGDVIYMDSIKKLIENVKVGKRFFFFKRGRQMASTISFNLLKRMTNITSARHCQPGQEAYIYNMISNIKVDCFLEL